LPEAERRGADGALPEAERRCADGALPEAERRCADGALPEALPDEEEPRLDSRAEREEASGMPELD
jgi:hypothetical protein